METTFDELIYESDGSSEKSEAKIMFKLNTSRGARRSTRLQSTQNASPIDKSVRRSGRISTQSNASSEDLKTVIKTEKKPTKKTSKATKSKRASIKPKVEVPEKPDEDDNESEYSDTNDGKILGATEVDGKLKFVFQFKDDDNLVLISSDEANMKYPYIVIDFYESCMVWEETSDSEEPDYKE